MATNTDLNAKSLTKAAEIIQAADALIIGAVPTSPEKAVLA